VRGDNPLCALASGKVEKKPPDPTRVSSIVPKTPKPLQSIAIKDQTTGQRGGGDILLPGAKKEPLPHLHHNSPRYWTIANRMAGASSQQGSLEGLAQQCAGFVF